MFIGLEPVSAYSGFMKRLFFSLVVLFWGSAGARAEIVASRWLDFREARIRLLMDTETAQGRLAAGLEIALADGFKTYWRQAGDSGVPPMFDFAGSEALSALAVSFPFPERFDDGAGGKAWGYKQGVILPISGIVNHTDYRLSLALDFAVCGTMCIPLNGKLELSPATGVKLAVEEQGRLAAVRAGLPMPDEGHPAKVVRVEPGKHRWRVTLPYAGDIASMAAFAEGKGFLDVDAVEAGSDGNAIVTITGQPEPGSDGRFGPVRLTFGSKEKSFEKTLDLDHAPAP